MPFINTDIEGLKIFEPVVHKDKRGFFFESYNAQTCREAGIEINFLQDNQASSSYGVIRGLHYQLNPFAQTKLIRVLKGSILDVVVDIRKGSPSFGKTYSINLTEENKLQLLIPQGFAHGYAVLSETAEVIYKCDCLYNKEAEAGIAYNDAELEIDWLVPANERIVSEKDQSYPSFQQSRNNFKFI